MLSTDTHASCTCSGAEGGEVEGGAIIDRNSAGGMSQQ